MKKKIVIPAIIGASIVAIIALIVVLVIKSNDINLRVRTSDDVIITGMEDGAVLVDFTLKDQYNKLYEYKDYEDKFVVINIWATWCPDCKNQIPDWSKLYHEYENSDEVGLISIVTPDYKDKSRTEILNFLDETPDIDYPVLFNAGGNFYDSYKPQFVPATIIVDKDGKEVVRYYEGEATYDAINNKLKELLGE